MSRRGTSKRALLLIDYVNLFAFADSQKLAARAIVAAQRTAELKRRAARAKIPCIYANDNYGDWRSEFSALVRTCRKRGGASGKIATLLRPDKGDLSVLKPRHSAFYGTPLEFLLDELGVTSLIVTGLSADICVFATAQDAYVRKFKVWIPADCVAADTAEHEHEALDHMARTLKADIRRSADVKSL